MSDEEAMDARKSFIKRMFSTPTIQRVYEVEAEELADSLQAHIEIWEREAEERS